MRSIERLIHKNNLSLSLQRNQNGSMWLKWNPNNLDANTQMIYGSVRIILWDSLELVGIASRERNGDGILKGQIFHLLMEEPTISNRKIVDPEMQRERREKIVEIVSFSLVHVPTTTTFIHSYRTRTCTLYTHVYVTQNRHNRSGSLMRQKESFERVMLQWWNINVLSLGEVHSCCSLLKIQKSCYNKLYIRLFY